MDNRPIKGNSNGNYDMNFIDPTNDICSYYNGQTQLQDLIERYFETVTFHLTTPNFKLANDISFKIKLKQENQHLKDNCSVCLEKFKQGQKIKILPCQHAFHSKCVVPWFEEHETCPNCRFSLAEGTGKSQTQQ